MKRLFLHSSFRGARSANPESIGPHKRREMDSGLAPWNDGINE